MSITALTISEILKIKLDFYKWIRKFYFWHLNVWQFVMVLQKSNFSSFQILQNDHDDLIYFFKLNDVTNRINNVTSAFVSLELSPNFFFVLDKIADICRINKKIRKKVIRYFFSSDSSPFWRYGFSTSSADFPIRIVVESDSSFAGISRDDVWQLRLSSSPSFWSTLRWSFDHVLHFFLIFFPSFLISRQIPSFQSSRLIELSYLRNLSRSIELSLSDLSFLRF